MATPLTSEEVQQAADEHRAVWWLTAEDGVKVFATEGELIDWLDDNTPIEQTCEIGEPCESCQ